VGTVVLEEGERQIMKKKVLLINPPTGVFIRDDRCQSSVENLLVEIPRPPHELLTIATILQSDGHMVSIRDYSMEGKTFSHYENDLRQFTPDVLIINATIPSLFSDIKSARIAKQEFSQIKVILRCGISEQIAEEVLAAENDIDIILYGESDFAVLELLATDDLASVRGLYYRDAGRIVKTLPRPLLKSLDDLPIVNRDLIDNTIYVRPDNGRTLGMIEVSRGCPYSCIFCLAPSTYGHVNRRRSVASVVKEIEICITKYGIYDFHFKSDLFTCDHDWVQHLCAAIISKNLRIQWFANSRVDSVNESLLGHMKKSGCFALSYGVESGSQTILDHMKKKIAVADIIKAFATAKKIGLQSYAYFIIGFPWDTEATVSETIELCKKIDPDYVDFFFPYVFYGTELYATCKAMGLITELSYAQLQKQSYVAVQFPTLSLTQERLLQLRKKAMREFYLRPRFIFKVLRRCKSPGELLTIMRFGLSAIMKLVK
jgi:radical SAM superfamily enzyme YgiQ (UPF0313 family)